MLWGPTRGAGAPGPPAKKQRPNPEAEGGSKPAEQGALAPAVQAAPPPPAATATAAAPAAAAADTSPDQAETYDPVASLPDSPLFLMHTDAEKEELELANEGFMGVSLGDLVKGDIQTATIITYAIDPSWLFTACPRLLDVEGELVIIKQDQKIRGRQDLSSVKGSVFERRLQGTLLECTAHIPPEFSSHGSQHAKAILLQYKEGLRLIILSSNLQYRNARLQTEVLFWQDFPLREDGAADLSDFASTLRDFLAALAAPLAAKHPALPAKLAALADRHDFSSARVHLVASVPGVHTGDEAHKWGHLRLKRLLGQEPPFDAQFEDAALLGQVSSIGTIASWLPQLEASMLAGSVAASCGSKPLGGLPAGSKGMQIVWPVVEDVRLSLEGWAAGRSFSGSKANVERNAVTQRLCRWDADEFGRQEALPHSKFFMRYSEQSGDIAWCYAGSHNLSQPAWGASGPDSLSIQSYELGVLLVPRSCRCHFFAIPPEPFTPNDRPFHEEAPLDSQKDCLGQFPPSRVELYGIKNSETRQQVVNHRQGAR